MSVVVDRIRSPPHDRRNTTNPRVAPLVFVTLVALLAACDSKSHALEPAVEAGVTTAPADAPFDGAHEAAFTQATAHLIEDQAPEMSALVIGPRTLQLGARGSTDKQGLRVSLDRIWNDCQANPAGCEDATRDFVARIVHTVRTRDQPAKLSNVVGVLRPRAYVDQIGGPSAKDAFIEPFVDDLYMVYFVDLPDSMRSLAPADVEALRVDPRSLHLLAVANLLPRLGHLADALGTAKPGDLTVLRSGNVFESSRLLMTAEWDILAANLRKPIFVAAPAGDTVLVALAPSADQLANMRETARGMFAAAKRPVSSRVFRWTAGGWVVAP